MVTGLKAVSYKDRCAELGLETLQVRRERLDMALVHKYLHRQGKPNTVQDDERKRRGKDSASGRRKKHCITICQDRHKEGILCYQSSRDLKQAAR